MKINKLNLGKAFTQVRSAVNPKHGYYSHILLEADDEIRLTATNGSLFVRSNVDDGLIVEPGAVLIDASKLGQLNSLDKPFDIEQDGQIAHIKCGRSKLKFPLIDASTFPRIDPPLGEPWFEINFVEIAEKVTFAAADATYGRPEFECVSMQAHPNGFILVSTNGYRISEILCKSEQLTFEPILISADGLRACQQILKGLDKQKVWIEGNQCKLEHEKTIITLRLVDGTFPDYTAIIPKNPPSIFSADIKDIKEALKITTIAEGDKHCIGIDTKNGKLNFWAFSGTYQASEFVEVEGPIADFKTGINSKYLSEALKHIDGERVTFYFPDPATSCMLIDANNPEHRQIIACMTPPADLP